MGTLVSILIPCFNSERWIAQAIESALAQTWYEKEIILVDDGSTDRSLDVIRRFEGRIHWKTGPNCGGNAARNQLLELAHGEWVQYLDADDYLLPGKISQQMEALARYQKADAIFGPVTLEHWSENSIRQEMLPIPQLDDMWLLLARWWLPQTGAVLWRKQAIWDVGGWKLDQPCCQEHELYLRLLIGGKQLLYYPSNGAVYRQWSDTTVCKRNVPEVHRQRFDIERRMEAYLRKSNQLTAERQNAINQGRFEMARIAWQYDPAFAIDIVEVVRRSQPGFIPSGEAAPSKYRLLYRCFGFEGAENIASWKRNLRAPKFDCL